MRSDENTEDRLRELLHDPRWSLPSWPDAQERVRRAARRQRLRVIGAAAAAIAAIGIPLAFAGTSHETLSAYTTDLLTCHDSAGQQGRGTPPARLVNGVDGFIGNSNAYDTLPVQRLAGHRYLAWKTALSVAPDARPYRIVSVVSPASARLGYGLGTLAPARSVRLPACGHRYALYVGGIFVRHPACVILAVSGPAGSPTTIAVPILRPCSDGPRGSREADIDAGALHSPPGHDHDRLNAHRAAKRSRSRPPGLSGGGYSKRSARPALGSRRTRLAGDPIPPGGARQCRGFTGSRCWSGCRTWAAASPRD